MEVRLSSRLTFFYKFVFPNVWLLGFGFGTLAQLVNRASKTVMPRRGYAK